MSEVGQGRRYARPGWRQEPNDLLRQARLRMLSPSGSGRPMSRQELADAVNAYLWEIAPSCASVTDKWIGNLERGTHRWPRAVTRSALRAVLDADSDAQLGLFINRRFSAGVDAQPVRFAASPERVVRPDSLVVGPGQALKVVAPAGAVVNMVTDGRVCTLMVVAGAAGAVASGAYAAAADPGRVTRPLTLVAGRG